MIFRFDLIRRAITSEPVSTATFVSTPPHHTEEDPQLIQEHHDQIMAPKAPRHDDMGPAMDSNPPSNRHKHEYTGEPKSEGTVKRIKLSSACETQTEVAKKGQHLKELTSHIEAMDKNHESIKLKTPIVKNEHAVCSERYNDPWNKNNLQLAKIKDEVKVQTESLQWKEQQLREKTRDIEAERGECEDLKVDLKAVRVQLEETKRERDSANKWLHDYKNALATTQEKLNTIERELHDANSQLEEAKEEVDALRTVNDTNGAYNAKLQTSAKKAKDTLTKERREHKITEARLSKEKAKLEGQLKDLRQEFSTKKNEWNEQSTELVKKIRESKGRNHRYSNKVPDERVKEMVAELKFKISHFTECLGPPTNVADQELALVLTELMPDARIFLESGVLRDMLLQAYIWDWLRCTVFDPESKLWGGKLGRRFSQLYGRAQDELQGPKDDLFADYQYWRSSSSNFLVRLSDRSYSSELCGPDAMDMVMKLSKIYGNIGIEKATTMAMEILNDARELDITLRTLKAKFSWIFGNPQSDNQLKHRFGFNFQDSCMSESFRSPTNATGEQAHTVDLIVSPALFKEGNNDGADYETVRYCIKMEVVCNASRFLLQTKTLTNTQAGAL
ncbi:hypothetical protein VP1G_08815 [Cytospora mali]|uniref:Uncharacterized protein n=1 Tax=Cytospora mali TaxID=578113 RepID=A0A194VCZ6_CYTMA|nr:hypothetical protein VP1G_08815 [Valsa mali var. pyri (nom. inval.)]